MEINLRQELNRARGLLSDENGNTDQALRILHGLLKREGEQWPFYHYMGLGFLKKRQYKTAAGLFNKAVELGSADPETFRGLSVCHQKYKGYDKAEEFAKKSIELDESDLESWMQLARVYRTQARLNEALVCYQKANKIDPGNGEVAVRIADVYRDQGNNQKALELYEIALKINSDDLEAWLEKGKILERQGRYDSAEACYLEAVDQDNDYLPARIRLAELARTTGMYSRSESIYRHFLENHPEQAGARCNYALLKVQLGQFDEADKEHLKILKQQPGNLTTVSNYLMSLHYNPARTKEEIYKEHLRWAEQYAAGVQSVRPSPIAGSENKKLRVGLLSGGFWGHPVGWMITPGLEHLPKEEFDLFFYTTNTRTDQVTRRLQAVSSSWKSVVGYEDEMIARMIREDQIDILIELSGHSADNRLRAVSMEPAPVIVKWVGGLFNTTGLPAVDFLLTDAYESPEGEEVFYTEKLIRMPDDYICYLPPDYAPDVEETPLQDGGAVTFGCFNNPSKINRTILSHWAEILQQVPGSQLFLKGKAYESEELCERVRTWLGSAGISEERVLFEGQSPHKELLECYNRVDVALDPWPYSGGLTTCEALWMGVPVVTRPGPTFAGRHSATHLTNAGFEEWVCDSWDVYRETAVRLAADPERLAELRRTMRQQVAQSPLCDATRFAGHLSKALREAWRQCVTGNNSGADEWADHITISSDTSSSATIWEQTVLNRTIEKQSSKKSGLDVDVQKSSEGSNGKQVSVSTAKAKTESAASEAGLWKEHLEMMLAGARPLSPERHSLPEDLVVSLTSYPARFSTLHLTLLSLLNQTVKPDRILLWIAHEDRDELPDTVLNIQARGLEIRYCEDLRSYKKIIPTLREYPESFVVTADDDVFYWQTWLEELTDAWHEDPGSIIAHRVHRIQMTPEQLPAPYPSWQMGFDQSTKPSALNFPTGIGGVLYPPGVFHEDVTDHSRFMELCPHGDDIWLWWMYRLQGVTVRPTGAGRFLLDWPSTQESALWKQNLAGGRNDQQIQQMIRHYGFPVDESPVSGPGVSAVQPLSLPASRLRPEMPRKAEMLAQDLTKLKSAGAHRKWSAAQTLRKQIVRYLTEQDNPEPARLKQYRIQFNRLADTNYKEWEQTLFHSFGFTTRSARLEVQNRGAVTLCKPARELVARTSGIDDSGLWPIVHGSMADGRYTPYSDVDITLMIAPEQLVDSSHRSRAAEAIHHINQAIKKIDPTGHHGCFINLETDLGEWPESFMPLAVLNEGFLLNLSGLNRDIHLRPCSDLAYLTLHELCRFFLELPSQTIRQDTHTVKNIISRFFIINLLHYELVTGRYLDKRTILEEGMEEIAGTNQKQALRVLTAIRERWPDYATNTPGHVSGELLQRCAAAAEDILDHLDSEGHLDQLRTEWLGGR